MSQKCKFCGTSLEGYETLCPGCGREISPDGGAPADDWFMEETSEPAPRSSRRTEGDGAHEDRRMSARGNSGHPGGRRAARHMSDAPGLPDDFAGQRPARRPNGSGGVKSGKPAPQARRGGSARKKAASDGGRAALGSHPLNRRQRMILLGALAGAAVLLIALCAHLIWGGGTSDPVYDFSSVLNTYFDSVRTADADKFISTRPPEYVTYLTTGTGGAYPTQAVYRSEMASNLQQRLEGYEAEYGDVRAIRYTLTQITSYAHRCEALSDVLTAWYGFSNHSVTNAVIVDGKYTVQGTKATGEFEFENLLLIQIGDTWYFSPDTGSFWKAE
ncbi:MAG: hypothetical protein Q4E13_08975 [Clostridia bacterium]|nr:hypothetical protein [Clostridia bacterium]